MDLSPFRMKIVEELLFPKIIPLKLGDQDVCTGIDVNFMNSFVCYRGGKYVSV